LFGCLPSRKHSSFVHRLFFFSALEGGEPLNQVFACGFVRLPRDFSDAFDEPERCGRRIKEAGQHGVVAAREDIDDAGGSLGFRDLDFVAQDRIPFAEDGGEAGPYRF